MNKIGVGGIIGAVLGFLATKRIFGAIIGYFIGTAIDSIMGGAKSSNNSQYRQTYNYDSRYYTQRISEKDFATALLVLSGEVMKADGKIVKAELDFVKQFFKQQFSNVLAQQYILQFKDILKNSFNIQEVCEGVKLAMPLQQRTLIIQYLFGIARADGYVDKKEVDIISRIASFMGISSIEFEQLKSMFYKDAANAYSTLGINKTASNDEIKKAYRKMAIKHHPDKVAQLGEEHQKAAKEKFQKIQEAYELIKKERGL